jgi:hypothetical protein
VLGIRPCLEPKPEASGYPRKVCCLVLGTDWGCYTKQGSEGWARDNIRPWALCIRRCGDISGVGQGLGITGRRRNDEHRYLQTSEQRHGTQGFYFFLGMESIIIRIVLLGFQFSGHLHKHA